MAPVPASVRSSSIVFIKGNSNMRQMLSPVAVVVKSRYYGASLCESSSVLISGLQSQAPLPSG